MVDKVMFLAPDNPHLVLKLAGKRYKAENGVFKNLPPAAVADLEKLLLPGVAPHISQVIRRVDIEVAERKAKEFLAKQPPVAIKGPVTSGTSQAAKLREARAAQLPENLTGIKAADGSTVIPTNISTNVKDDKPLKVEEVPTTAPPKGNLLGRLGNKTP